MNYGIPPVPAAGGGVMLTVVGIHNNNVLVILIGSVLLVTALISHLKLRINER